jgi:hypothetical protein
MARYFIHDRIELMSTSLVVRWLLTLTERPARIVRTRASYSRDPEFKFRLSDRV